MSERYNTYCMSSNAGAGKYADDVMAEVGTDVENADDMQEGKHRDVKMELTYAREAVQRSEDARITTLRKQAAERDRNNLEAKEAAQQQAAASQQQAAASQVAAANSPVSYTHL